MTISWHAAPSADPRCSVHRRTLPRRRGPSWRTSLVACAENRARAVLAMRARRRQAMTGARRVTIAAYNRARPYVDFLVPSIVTVPSPENSSCSTSRPIG